MKKNENIILSAGLDVSIKVLNELSKLTLNKEVTVGTFTNCRECGYTFRVSIYEPEYRAFTFCVYEHRNSDKIIINGKEGCISLNGDLPYNGDSKWDYLHSFDYDQHKECALKLQELINNF